MHFQTILLFLTISFTLNDCRSAVSRLPSEPSSAYPGECYHPSSGLHLPRGRSSEIRGQCQGVHCAEDFILEFINCGQLDFRKGCYRTEGDPDLPWPQCCPALICPN